MIFIRCYYKISNGSSQFEMTNCETKSRFHNLWGGGSQRRKKDFFRGRKVHVPASKINSSNLEAV